MKTNKRVAWIYTALTVVLTVGSVILKNIADKTYMDDKVGFYKNDFTTPTALHLFLILAGAILLTSMFFMNGELIPESRDGFIVTLLIPLS